MRRYYITCPMYLLKQRGQILSFWLQIPNQVKTEILINLVCLRMGDISGLIIYMCNKICRRREAQMSSSVWLGSSKQSQPTISYPPAQPPNPHPSHEPRTGKTKRRGGKTWCGIEEGELTAHIHRADRKKMSRPTHIQQMATLRNSPHSKQTGGTWNSDRSAVRPYTPLGDKAVGRRPPRAHR